MTAEYKDAFGARAALEVSEGRATIYRLDRLAKSGMADLERMPRSIKVLLEAALRLCDGFRITEDDVARIAGWRPDLAGAGEIPFRPARVILQDFTGVPSVVDLAALRSAMQRLGGDPGRVNPGVPVDLVIDHSVQVDFFASPEALERNAALEFERNRERYELLKWATQAFSGFRVVPPATGIVHQVNLEYLATVVAQGADPMGGPLPVLFPDSVVGTDSHTTMINGLGVLGWGVGGIEAEAVMLGEAISMLLPAVVGVRLEGCLPAGCTATDLVLTVTEMLRKHGVVGKIVEFFGSESRGCDWPTAPPWPTWRPSTAPRPASFPWTMRPCATWPIPAAVPRSLPASSATAGSRACSRGGEPRSPSSARRSPWT